MAHKHTEVYERQTLCLVFFPTLGTCLFSVFSGDLEFGDLELFVVSPFSPIESRGILLVMR